MDEGSLPAHPQGRCSAPPWLARTTGLRPVNHQLFRLLAPEAVDIGGWPQKCFVLNGGRSLLAETNPVNPMIMHLDPWHKMLVGWIEPRVYDIATPGFATLAAQHLSSSEPALTRPILLFDPHKGSREFFLLEYRAQSPVGGRPIGGKPTRWAVLHRHGSEIAIKSIRRRAWTLERCVPFGLEWNRLKKPAERKR
jgi:hypothetical protein